VAIFGLMLDSMLRVDIAAYTPFSDRNYASSSLIEAT